jgi:hypothetical protein
MKMARFGRFAVAALAVAAIGMALACSGGGGSDESKIKARVERAFDQASKADAKGFITNLPPDKRASCDEKQLAEALGFLKAFNVKLKETKVKAINGDKADISLTVSAKIADKEETNTSDGRMVKVNNEWYLDDEGEGCGDVIGS